MTAPTNAGSDPGASFNGVSCSSSESCAAVGSYTDSGGNTQAMVSGSGDLGPTVSAVTFGGTVSAPTVTVSGSGFGTEADLGAPTTAGCGLSGSNYDNNFEFA